MSVDQDCPDPANRSGDGSDVKFVWLPWLQLMRVGNVFTAFANILMGYLVVRSDEGSIQLHRADILQLAGLLAATFCLYTAGMVLNDVFDLDRDLQDRPQRPLAAGRISQVVATRFGWGLLIAGIGFSATAGLRGCILGLAVAMSVLAYNRILKQTLAAPLAMGACRFFNVLLGMSYAESKTAALFAWEHHHLLIAAGIGIFVAGLTWFARTEARQSSRWVLAFGVLVMSLGFVCLASFTSYVGDAVQLQMTPDGARMLFSLLALLILYRCFGAIMDPQPRKVQPAVIHCLRSLIFLDACVVAIVSHSTLAVATIALLFPMLVCSKWIRAT